MLPDEEVLQVLQTVDDPELSHVSVYDLGMVDSIVVTGNMVAVTMVPTFAGCPALDFIERDVKKAVEKLFWVHRCDVAFSLEVPWTTDSITEHGKNQLKKIGISPPPENYVVGAEWTVACPYCDSSYTSMENVFGPTACRSILYCLDCHNPFEAMKPVISHETLA
jgi:ring-1,2-phenylacetyl-CoA epoxidase subunit PaaD